MQYFNELSDNQKAAMTKPCRKCGVGPCYDNNGAYLGGHGVQRKMGRFGPWVQCSNCGDKVYRPRGRSFSTGSSPFGGGSSSTVESGASAGTGGEGGNGNGSPKPSAPPIQLDAEQLKEAAAKVQATLTERVSTAVEKMAKDAKEHVEKETADTLKDIQEKMSKLENAQPVVIEVRRPDETTYTATNEHYLFPRALKLASAGITLYLWGEAGSGKTTGAQHIAEALGRESEIDTTDPTTFRSMIQGYMTPQGEPVHTAFSRCWSTGKVYVCDEVDNAPGHVQTLFNSALANGHAPLAWGNVSRHETFSFIGTGNTPGRPTREFPDRKPMSAAFADRLYFIHWPIDPAIECRLGGLDVPPRVADRMVEVSKAKWVEFVRKVREWAKANAPQLMVTPRASIVGLQALTLGETPDQVADGLIFRGADNELRTKCMSACKTW